MSGKEVRRLEVLRQVTDGVVSQTMAQTLGLSVRQIRRLQHRYDRGGAAGLASQRRGQRSNRRLPDEVKDEILARLRECYAGFGPTLTSEYLQGERLQVRKETWRG